MEDDGDTELLKEPSMPNLRWEDVKFQRHVLNALNQMRKSRQFCDVTLRVGLDDISCHRVVLAAASPYFVELFTRERDGPSRREVEGGGGIVYDFKGFSMDSLERLVEYAYTSVLNVPGELLKAVYTAASKLRLDRAANECARFMASNMDLSSCLELRSSPCVASSAFLANGGGCGENNGEGIDKEEDDEVISQRPGINLISCVDEHIAATDLEQLQSNREFLALPRFCVEVLQSSKEEVEIVRPQPLVSLVLEWAHKKWQDDNTVEIDQTFVEKSTLLIMSKDNTLQDCTEVEEGSEHDSDLIQDYKKSNQHLEKPKARLVGRRKPGSSSAAVKPAKPKEMLYTRQINQEDGSREYSDPYFWKVIKVHRLDNRSIMGVVSMDGKLIIMSIVQRVNVPTASTSPTMVRSVSACSLKAGLKSPVGSKGSRPSSLDKDVYVPVANMKYAKCASGSVSFNGKLVVCGGFDRGECLNKVEAYNAEINAWEKWPSMLSKRGRFDATVVDDKLIYAVGGSNGHSEEASVEVYDPEVGKWAHGPSLPVALSNIGLSSLDGVVYCIGGSNGSTGSKVCFKLKPGSPKWQRIADLHIGRFQAAVVAFEGRIWAVGGCESWSPLNSLEIYEPATDTWSIGPSLNTPRRGCGLAVLKGRIWAVGGTDGTASMCTTEVLDMVENAWHPGPTMTFCRGNVSVAVVNEQLWAVGGFSGKNFLNSVEFLDPGEEWTSYLPVTDDKDPAVKDEGDEKENENPDIEIELAKSNGDE